MWNYQLLHDYDIRVHSVDLLAEVAIVWI